jgi:Flp pilus assembly protein TadG
MLRPRTKALRTILQAAPRGAAIIEFALILPFLALLVVGLCDLGFAAYGSMQVQAAAEAGAQYAALNGWNPTAIATAVTRATGASGISATPAPSEVYGCPDGGTLTIVASTVTCPSGSPPGLYASISAQLAYVSVLPYPGLPSPLTLTGQAYRRIQ